MAITAADVNKLRQQTGAGMMDCKKALEETNGDFEAAIDYLRKKGAKVAANRQDRDAKEGVVLSKTSSDNKNAVVVSVNCETDFVAKNELFEALGRDLAMQLASMGEEKFEDQDYIKDTSKKVSDLVKEVKAKTGENIRIGRVFRVELGK